jgi:hypothetical protein
MIQDNAFHKHLKAKSDGINIVRSQYKKVITNPKINDTYLLEA